MQGRPAGRGFAEISRAEAFWPRLLDLATFDMSRPARSLLVQLYGSADEGLVKLGIPPDKAGEYGFEDRDYAEVCTWLVLITTALAEAGPPEPAPAPRAAAR